MPRSTSLMPLAAFTGLLLLACGGGGGGGSTQTPPPPPIVNVTVTPSQARILPGGHQILTATVVGSSNTAVTWSVVEGASGGTVSSSGVYTAPPTLGTFHVQATSVANPNDSSTATLQVSRFSLGSNSLFPHDRGAATRLMDGRTLLCGGYGSKKAEIFDPAFGTFNPVGDLSVVRMSPTATLLSNGKVLVAGGYELKSAELFDPATNAFSPLPDMTDQRAGHSAILLNTGKVLLVGTDSNLGMLSTDLFDPDTGCFIRTGDLHDSRRHPSATLLPDGRVLVSGGFLDKFPGNVLATAELYNPQTGKWARAGSMNTGRAFHSATLLANGKVVVAGGVDETYNSLNSAEVFDPALGTSMNTGSLAKPRDSHTALRLSDGTVFIASGWYTKSVTIGSSSSTTSTGMDTFERYDPNLGTFQQGDENTPGNLYGETNGAGLQPDGLPIFFTILGPSVYHLPDLAPGIAVKAPFASMTLPPKGKVLLTATVTGASDSGVFWSIEEGGTGGTMDQQGLYQAPTEPGTYHVVAASHQDPSKNAIIAMNVAASGVSVVINPGNAYMITGGQISLSATANGNPSSEMEWLVQEGDAGGKVTSMGAYTAPSSAGTYHVVAQSLWDPSVQANATLVVEAGGALTSLSLPKPLHDLDVVRLLDGRVLVSGGASTPAGSGADQAVSEAYFFDPATNAFTPAGTMTSTRQEHRGALMPDGRVLISGGVLMLPYTLPLATQEWFTPGSGFAATGNLANGRTRHDISNLPDGTLFMFGNPTYPVPKSEVFDPTTGIATGNPDPSNPLFPPTGRAISLDDGRVLVLAESNLGDTTYSYLYDPIAKTWTALPARGVSRSGMEVVRLRDGRVLILGGAPNEPRAELFDPATSTYQWTGALFQNRDHCKATLLPNGTVLVTGGLQVFSGVAQCELYDPTSGLFSTAGVLPKARFKHGATVLPNGKVLILGGAEASGTDYGVKGIDSVVAFDILAPPGVSVGILTSKIRLKAGKAWPFQGTVSGAANWTLNWSVVEAGGGTITPQGVYTAPALPGTYHVVATSVADSTKKATATVVVATQ